MSSMVNAPVFGIHNSSAPTASSAPVSTAPLAPVTPTVVAGATPYNASLNWLEYTGTGTAGGGIMNTNYSPQTQITNQNINQLQVSYLFPVPSALSSATPFTTRVTGYTYNGGNEGTQAAVLTNNGTGYVLSNYLNIYGFNLATGAQLATPNSCPAIPSGSSLGALLKAGTCSLGAPGEIDPAFDFGAYLKSPEAGGGPSHQHGWNIVTVPGAGAVAWVPGWGCSIQGWQVSTGKLVANLTGMCDNTPGSIHPTAGSGKTFSNGIGEVQVSTKYNEIIFWEGGNSEGTGGMPMNVYACSLTAALAGQNCVPTGTGAACLTSAGGLCGSGSTMLWRTFLMPAYDGSTPNFAANLCAKGHIWIVGVPCSAIQAVNNVISYDSQRPDLASRWGGDPIAPSTGCSGAWGQIALDEADGIMAIGTGDTGPDWNHTLTMGFSILCNAVVGLNLQNGTVAWGDKSFTKDINDEDCNLNTSFVKLTAANGGNLMPNGGPVFVKTCKSSATFAVQGVTGQPLWFLDPTMPDYTTINSATTSPITKALICSTTNATACDPGRIWDQIFHKIKTDGTTFNAQWISGSIKMQGTNPHPHGFVTGSPLRGESILDPLNNTEIGTCTGVGTTSVSCNPGATCPTGMHAACVANDVQGKGPGYYENRYLAESEDGVDPVTGVFFSVVMTGPMEHDWIGDVDKQGQSGNVSGSNLYFAGSQTTNATLLAIQIGTGQVLWNYTRQIYYRGGIIMTGGMVVSDWPDGHLIFNDEKTGAVLRDINVGVPLLAPMSIGPDLNGVEHLLVSYGGTNHGILGENGLHGPLGHGYVTTGAVISYVLGPAPASGPTSTTTVTSAVTSTVTGAGGSTSVVTSTFTSVSTVSGGGNVVSTTTVSQGGVSDLAFYGAVGVAAILAIVAGALVVLRRRPSA